ncbi:hypothetical protein C8F01DRAFT_1094244 [Mycena amicta]|nr:hypothetical protein C8F01DRAFT_1094244 [Mycena amicta]
MKLAVIVSLMAVVGSAVASSCAAGQVYTYPALVAQDPGYKQIAAECAVEAYKDKFNAAQVATSVYKCTEYTPVRRGRRTALAPVTCGQDCKTLNLLDGLLCLDLNLNL